ncbi:hypothetical protein AB0L44_00495 [Nonomuraea wenchangensis]|uniref:hypothetical protein n=1 Tax=Nonomuraea wenchangensis TaxID=568860 RepID=UPI00342D693A
MRKDPAEAFVPGASVAPGHERVEALRPCVERMAEELASQEGGVSPAEVARLLAAMAAGKLLGVPERDRDALADWLDDATAHLDTHPDAEAGADAGELIEGYLAELVEVRSCRPGDDLISDLLRAELPETQVLRLGHAALTASYVLARAEIAAALQAGPRTTAEPGEPAQPGELGGAFERMVAAAAVRAWAGTGMGR